MRGFVRRGSHRHVTPRHRGIGFYVALLAGLIGLATFIAGCVSLKELILQASVVTPTPAVTPTPTPAPGVFLTPAQVAPGERVTVTGEGWRPADTVFIRLQAPTGEPGPQTALAAAIIAETGTFTATFTFPLDPRWTSLPAVDVIAWSPATGDQARAPLGIRQVTVTATPTPSPTPSPSPTATPTRPAPTATPTPRPVPPPTATPTPVIVAWRGEYYGNRDLIGPPLLVRNDADVNFDWGFGGPGGPVPADNFSARWTRTLYFPEGTYRFYVRSDDGVRVWVDNDLIIDQWHLASGFTYSAEKALSAALHVIRVEYFEQQGIARVQLWWERTGTFPDWRGEYFPNRDLVGDPWVVRNDGQIDFDWGTGAPAPGLPADRFSVRWTRLAHFDPGTYRFHAVVDDGVRVYLDGERIIDDWRDGGERELVVDRAVSSGDHTLRVEYYEQTGRARIKVWWERLADSYPDWRADFWANRDLSGAPVLTRNDVNIDFDWGRGSPGDGVPADHFSARWQRDVEFSAGTYRFHVIVDDGARLWVDGQRLIDDWRDGSARELTAEYALAKGKHKIVLEYYEKTGDARIRLWWEKVSSPSYPDWKGEYWSNKELRGSPTLIRNDAAVDFDWGAHSPAVGLPPDGFSARWSRSQTFTDGVYRFYVQADDGARVYVDGALIIDAWHQPVVSEVHTYDMQLAGQHTVTVEFREDRGVALIHFWWERLGPLPTPTHTPTATFTPTPTATFTPTPTPTDTPTPTATFTPTPTATVTVTPTPTATPTVAEPPYLSVSPTRAGPGEPLRVAGTEWPAGATVTIGLIEPRALITEGLAITQTMASTTGAFTTTIAIPNERRWLSLTTVEVYALAQENGLERRQAVTLAMDVETTDLQPRNVQLNPPREAYYVITSAQEWMAFLREMSPSPLLRRERRLPTAQAMAQADGIRWDEELLIAATAAPGESVRIERVARDGLAVTVHVEPGTGAQYHIVRVPRARLMSGPATFVFVNPQGQVLYQQRILLP